MDVFIGCINATLEDFMGRRLKVKLDVVEK